MKISYLFLVISVLGCGGHSFQNSQLSSDERPVTPEFLPRSEKGIITPFDITEGAVLYAKAGKLLKELLDKEAARLSINQLEKAKAALKRFESLKIHIFDKENKFVGLIDFKNKNDKRLADANFLREENLNLEFQLKQFGNINRELIEISVKFLMWKQDRIGFLPGDNARRISPDYNVNDYVQKEQDIIHWYSEKLVPWMLTHEP